MTQKMPFIAATCAGSGAGAAIRLALYQPDIPQNAGSLMRLCACLGLAMDIIEPCGFLQFPQGRHGLSGGGGTDPA
jgi:hypothetical protein